MLLKGKEVWAGEKPMGRKKKTTYMHVNKIAVVRQRPTRLILKVSGKEMVFGINTDGWAQSPGGQNTGPRKFVQLNTDVDRCA